VTRNSQMASTFDIHFLLFICQSCCVRPLPIIRGPWSKVHCDWTVAPQSEATVAQWGQSVHLPESLHEAAGVVVAQACSDFLHAEHRLLQQLPGSLHSQ